MADIELEPVGVDNLRYFDFVRPEGGSAFELGNYMTVSYYPADWSRDIEEEEIARRQSFPRLHKVRLHPPNPALDPGAPVLNRARQIPVLDCPWGIVASAHGRYLDQDPEPAASTRRGLGRAKPYHILRDIAMIATLRRTPAAEDPSLLDWQEITSAHSAPRYKQV